MRQRFGVDSSRARASVISVCLCVVAGICVVIALMHLAGLCQDGTHASCRDGDPSFVLVSQFVLALAGLVAAFAAIHFAKRHAQTLTRAAVAASIVLLAGWVVLVDAATHGWDDLRTPSLALGLLVVVTLGAIFTAFVRRMRTIAAGQPRHSRRG
jgi:uncharacterized membrane protein YoaK (UPF0700 family)